MKFFSSIVRVVAVALLVAVSVAVAPVQAEMVKDELCLYIVGGPVDERAPLKLNTFFDFGPAIGLAAGSQGPLFVFSYVRPSGDGSSHSVTSFVGGWTISADYGWFEPVVEGNGLCLGGPCGEGQRVTLSVDHKACL